MTTVPPPPALQLAGIGKSYSNAEAPAVSGLDLTLNVGEIVTLLGPSGCGKSTTLRIVAGLEDADAGTVCIDGEVVVDVARGIRTPIDKRNIGMVFQSYAIWPHMDVAANVGFPLRMRKVPAAEIRTRVAEVLELVGLAGTEQRMAVNLSGGQQQRIALARALVLEPRLLLLDEPFSNLDAKLRERMRADIKAIQRRLGMAVLFVTHDQVEALALSDRIVMMRAGGIEQIGSPRDVYTRPTTAFVRDFVGATLLLRGALQSVSPSGEVCITPNGHEHLRLFATWRSPDTPEPGDAAILAVRPESVTLTRAGSSPAMRGRVLIDAYLGDRVEYLVTVADQGELSVHGDQTTNGLTPGDEVDLSIDGAGHTAWSPEESAEGK